MALPKLEAGDKANLDDLRRAQSRERFLDTELDRVRNAATSWRNGLAGLLAAITGFGLIKGQSDISQLSPGWAAAAGVLLLTALVVGLIGAMYVLRAAHGLPLATAATSLGGWDASEHREAVLATRSLRVGIACALACVTALVAAVGVTWYGPSRASQSFVEVITGNGAWCGRSPHPTGSELSLQAGSGSIQLPISAIKAIVPVDSCG
jgi:hypothetical protein